MRAKNVSSNTVIAYGGAVRQFRRWLIERACPTDVDRNRARRVEEWIAASRL